MATDRPAAPAASSAGSLARRPSARHEGDLQMVTGTAVLPAPWPWRSSSSSSPRRRWCASSYRLPAVTGTSANSMRARLDTFEYTSATSMTGSTTGSLPSGASRVQAPAYRHRAEGGTAAQRSRSEGAGQGDDTRRPPQHTPHLCRPRRGDGQRGTTGSHSLPR